MRVPTLPGLALLSLAAAAPLAGQAPSSAAAPTTAAAPGATPVDKAVVQGVNARKPNPKRARARAVEGLGTAPPTQAQMVAAVDKGQYEADRLAYRNAVIAHNIEVAHDQKRYEIQQDKYAQAMAAWRAQVAACRAGDKQGCEQPEPDPATFY